MVKFGRHCEAFAAENGNLYVVPYANIRNNLIENIADKHDPIHNEKFEQEWQLALKNASKDFGKSMVNLWQNVFDGIIKLNPKHGDEIRGALPDTALRTYLSLSTMEDAQELLSMVKQIYNTALTNSEALRKLVKKFDKQHGQNLSHRLLSQVYGSNFTTGQSTLQAGISLIRASLGLDEGYDSDSDDDGAGSVSSVGKVSKTSNHDYRVQKRQRELDWLKRLVTEIPEHEIGSLIAHRGFHNVSDRSDYRPLENSLASYEAAWTSGIPLCECDIALTRDEKLILAHDEDFMRLALDPNADLSKKKIGDITYRELMSMPLKTGNRPPLLIDVLRSAEAIGGKSQLVIEIKPGNVAAASALARLFLRHPDLMARCSTVMSFDAFAMHTLRKDLQTLVPMVEEAKKEGVESLPRTASVSFPTNMSIGNLGYRVDLHSEGINQSQVAMDKIATDNSSPKFHHGHKRTESHDHFGVGLADNLPRSRSSSFSFTPFMRQPQNSPQPKQNVEVGTDTDDDYAIGMTPDSSPSLTSLNTNIANLTIANSKSNSPSNDKGNNGPMPLLLPPRAMQQTGAPPTPPMLKPAPPKVQSKVPKLLLLTVSEKPKNQYELVLNIDDILQVEDWIVTKDGSLDGAYLQYEPDMLTEEGARNLRKLSSRGYLVGVWQLAGKDPDCYEMFHHLVEKGGVSFVNTDLPRGFKKGVAPAPMSPRRGTSHGGHSFGM